MRAAGIERVGANSFRIGVRAGGAKDGSLLERTTDVREVALESPDLRTLIQDFRGWLSIYPLRMAVALGSVITLILFVGTVAGLTARRFRPRT